MVQVVNANSLTLREVRDRLQLRFEFDSQFRDFLTLSPLTQPQRDRLMEIRRSWQHYYLDDKISEGQVSVLALTPMLWESGYASDPTLQILVERDIEAIAIEDGDKVIRGRMDLVINQRWDGDLVPLCVLVIETKNSAADPSVGLPQLLTYVGTFLKHQECVWGLVTTGKRYEFIRVEAGICYHFPSLDLMQLDQAEEMLSVLVAIREDFHRGTEQST